MACADLDTQLSDVVNHRVGLEQTQSILGALASSKNFVELVRGLKEEDARRLADVLDQVIGSIDRRNTHSTTLLRALAIICSVTGQLPCSVVLSDGLKKLGSMAVASGGFTDVWRGTQCTKIVAIKAFRTYPIQDLKDAKKILWREVVVWKRLSHKNILPFYGVDMTNFQLALVYDWMECGNITQYLNSHPGVSRTCLLHEVAQGLRYLHSSGVVHGDLKGSNVLISPSGNACLSDYGLMHIQSNHAFMNAATPGVVGISRWLAPELINPPRKRGHRQEAGTEQADIFAFAMLAIEVFTGALPFGDVRHETAILMIAQGQRPGKPQGVESRGFTPDIWKFIQKCWNQNPAKRPGVSDVEAAWKRFESQERLREYTLAVLPISREKCQEKYHEKHQPQLHKSVGKSADGPKKTRFCGLF